MIKLGTTNIASIPGIAKVMLGSDLVWPINSPLPDNYVTDGLVLWLDGIDKGPDSTGWVDKIDGVKFTNHHDVVFGTDYLEFDGEASYLANSSFAPPAASSGTIEVVFEASSLNASQMIFMPKSGASRLAFYFTTAGRVYIAGGSSTSRETYLSSLSANTKVSYSVNNSAGYMNGTSLSTSSNSYMGGANSYNYIGKRRSEGDASGNNFFAGKIYSIRLYSRQLTSAEVAANLAVDNVRFQMGLTL